MKFCRAVVLVSIAAVSFCTLFSTLALARFLTFHNQTFDLAFYARMAWGLVHWRWWDPIIDAHFFGLHVSWVMAPLGALGLVFGTVPVLLVVQAAAVCAVCWPLYRMGSRRAGELGAVLAPAIWLLYPNLGHVTTYEFHPGNLALLPLVLALDCLDRERTRALGWLIAAVVACRADLTTATFILGLLFYWQGGELRKPGLLIAVFSLVYLALYSLVMIPLLGPKHGSLGLHFGKWGSGPLEMAGNILLSPAALFEHLSEPRRLLYLPKLLAPLLFLPLLAPRWLLLAVPQLAVNLLSDFPTATDMDCHYTTLIVPALAVATVEALGRLQERRLTRLVVPPLVAASLGATLFWGGMPWSLDFDSESFAVDEQTRSGRALVSLIPPRASVQAPYRLMPHLAERPAIYRQPPPDRNADYVVLDISHRRRYQHDETLLRTSEEPNARNWLSREGYGLLAAAGDLVLLKRGAEPRQGLGRRYIVGRAEDTEGEFLTGCLRIIEGRLWNDAVCLDLVATGPCPSDLAVRLCSAPVTGRSDTASDRLAIIETAPGKAAHRVDLLFDGLLSPVHLRSGDRVRSCHSLDPRQRRAVAEDGLYLGALRSSGARPEPTDPWAVRVPLLPNPAEPEPKG